MATSLIFRSSTKRPPAEPPVDFLLHDLGAAASGIGPEAASSTPIPAQIERAVQSGRIEMAFPIPLLQLTSDLKVLFVNQAFLNDTGYDGDAVGRSLYEVLPQLAPALEPLCRNVIRTGNSVRQIVPGAAGSHSRVAPFTLCLVSALPEEGTQESGIVIALADISPEREAQYRLNSYSATLANSLVDLRRAHGSTLTNISFLSSVLDSIPDPVIVLLSNFDVYLNPRARTLFGMRSKCSSSSLVRHDFNSVVPQHLLGVLPFEQARNGEQIKALEVSLPVFGRSHQVEYVCTTEPLRERADSSPIGGVMVLRDISEQKQLERNKIRAAQELERSNRDLEQFVLIASHDLREPLRTAIRFLGLLDRKIGATLDEESRVLWDFAENGVQRMQRMLEQLTKYARVGIGSNVRADVDLKQIFESVVNDLSFKIQETHAELVFGVLPVVTGNREQLTQLFQNLICNAIKFRKETPLRIDVWANLDGPDCVVRIKDNGIGIAEAGRKGLFEMFGRGQFASGREGQGVGLAVVKRIAERHGGKVWLESTLGEGSTFSVQLPLASPAKFPERNLLQ